jgi:hypothetical protein
MMDEGNDSMFDQFVSNSPPKTSSNKLKDSNRALFEEHGVNEHQSTDDDNLSTLVEKDSFEDGDSAFHSVINNNNNNNNEQKKNRIIEHQQQEDVQEENNTITPHEPIYPTLSAKSPPKTRPLTNVIPVSSSQERSFKVNKREEFPRRFDGMCTF